MRRAAKVDANQSEIVEAIRGIGGQVVFLHAVGGGVPDLLCYYAYRSFLLEVKDGDKVPSARKLTEDQVKFHDWWLGELHVVCNAQEAVNACIHGDKNGNTQ
jgi:hypothetical protein